MRLFLVLGSLSDFVSALSPLSPCVCFALSQCFPLRLCLRLLSLLPCSFFSQPFFVFAPMPFFFSEEGGFLTHSFLLATLRISE